MVFWAGGDLKLIQAEPCSPAIANRPASVPDCYVGVRGEARCQTVLAVLDARGKGLLMDGASGTAH